jgi:alpha-1,3-rhamnosyl/mannosyltransferase
LLNKGYILKIKLALNATSILTPKTGIGKYTYHLAQEFLRSDNVEVTFFYGGTWSKVLIDEPVKGLSKLKSLVKMFLPSSYALNRRFQAIKFRMLRDKTIDIYHDPNYLLFPFAGKKVITVHDLSFMRHPDAHPAIRVNAMKKYFPQAIKQADAIITDSYFSKRELLEYYDVNPNKVFPIHLGVEDKFCPRKESECSDCIEKYNLQYRNYILVVGTLEPRKNLSLVLKAYQILPDDIRKKYPLVVVGMKGWGTPEIEEQMKPLEKKKQLKLLGYVPEQDLPLLYAAAKLFVYPSLYEGFGLPPLEAMASGIPVITSDQASLPEVVGKAGVQVGSCDVDGLMQEMKKILKQGEYWSSLREAGLVQASKFSWKKCADETISVYKSLL